MSSTIVDDKGLARRDGVLLLVSAAAWVASGGAPAGWRAAFAIGFGLVTVIRFRLAGLHVARGPWRQRVAFAVGIPTFRTLGAGPVAARRLGFAVGFFVLLGILVG